MPHARLIPHLDTVHCSVHLWIMPDDEKPETPDAIDDVKKGLGLLFRAARTAVKKLPTEPIEKVVIDGAKEVGRAVENVASTIEKEIREATRGKSAPPPSETQAKADAPHDAPTNPGGTPPAEPKSPDDSKGPRVD
jgi:hypothetical protein